MKRIVKKLLILAIIVIILDILVFSVNFINREDKNIKVEHEIKEGAINVVAVSSEYFYGKIYKIDNNFVYFNNNDGVSYYINKEPDARFTNQQKFIDGKIMIKTRVKEFYDLENLKEGYYVIVQKIGYDLEIDIWEEYSEEYTNCCLLWDPNLSEYDSFKVYSVDSEKIYKNEAKTSYLKKEQYEFIDGITNEKYDINQIKENYYIVVAPIKFEAFVFESLNSEFIKKDILLDPNLKYYDEDIRIPIEVKNARKIDENRGIATVNVFYSTDEEKATIDVEFDRESVVFEYSDYANNYDIDSIDTFIKNIDKVSDMTLDNTKLDNEYFKVKEFNYYIGV